MTNATCRPSLNSVPLQEREQRPDHLGDLLESLADLLIEVGQQRAPWRGSLKRSGPSAPEAVERLGWLEEAIKGIGWKRPASTRCCSTSS